MNNRLNIKERQHLARVKSLPCSLCDTDGPSEAHHIEQGQAYTCVALCIDCHRGPVMGWHGQKRMWAIKKMTELLALNVTIERLNALSNHPPSPYWLKSAPARQAHSRRHGERTS